MKRVEKALVDLSTTNLRSNQNAISDFNALLNTGSAKLQEMLRVELNQHATPIEPLHYLTKGAHVAQPTKSKLIHISARSTFPIHPRRNNLSSGASMRSGRLRICLWTTARQGGEPRAEGIRGGTGTLYQNQFAKSRYCVSQYCETPTDRWPLSTRYQRYWHLLQCVGGVHHYRAQDYYRDVHR